jgi:hypothetical protein
MLANSSPAKLVLDREFLNQHIKNWEFASDYGEHASAARKPKVIAEHPPDNVRFNYLIARQCGGVHFLLQPLNSFSTACTGVLS